MPSASTVVMTRPRPLQATSASAPGPIEMRRGRRSGARAAVPCQQWANADRPKGWKTPEKTTGHDRLETAIGPARHRGHATRDEAPLAIQAEREEVAPGVGNHVALGKDGGPLLGAERLRRGLIDLQRQEGLSRTGHEPTQAKMGEHQDTVGRQTARRRDQSPALGATLERRDHGGAVDNAAGPQDSSGQPAHIGERVEPPARRIEIGAMKARAAGEARRLWPIEEDEGATYNAPRPGPGRRASGRAPARGPGKASRPGARRTRCHAPAPARRSCRPHRSRAAAGGRPLRLPGAPERLPARAGAGWARRARHCVPKRRIQAPGPRARARRRRPGRASAPP